MDGLYEKLKLKNFEDWLKVPRSTLVENGGQSLISYCYANDMKKLLTSIYPNYSWDFDKLKVSSKSYFEKQQNQQKFVDNLFIQLKLNSLEDFSLISRNIICKYGGKSLLLYYYSNDIKIMFSSLYPNYPWNSLQSKFPSKLSSIEYQRSIMDELFRKLKLTSMDDWLKISKEKFMKKGGKNLLEFHSNDYSKLLSSIYPDHDWKFDNMKKNYKEYFKSLDNQRKYMDHLFNKFGLNSLDDWTLITKSQFFSQSGGKILLVNYYGENIKDLLLSIYPHHHWKFEGIKINSNNYFHSIENQKIYMEDLYLKLNLKSLNDWLQVPKIVFYQNGGKTLIEYFYANDLQKLLKSIYPSHFFPFELFSKFKDRKKLPSQLHSIENQRILMNKLFKKFQLKSLDDWLTISRSNFVQSKGRILLEFYQNQMQNLLSFIYPDHCWNFDHLKVNTNLYFKSLSNQRKFMDYLFIKFKLKSMDDWLQISKNKIIENGGKSLLQYYYANDLKKLLSSIYPNHHFQFDKLLKRKRTEISFNSIENQKLFLDSLFYKFDLKSLDDWLNFPKKNIQENGGKLLLSSYENNYGKLLSTIYPNYAWEFDFYSSFRSSHEYFKRIENQKDFMDYLFVKLKLKSLNDWLQLPKRKIIENGGKSLLNYYYFNNLSKLLITIYPDHAWKFDLYSPKVKKKSEIKRRSIDSQRSFMHSLFHKLELKSIDDWMKISKKTFRLAGGATLLSFYSHDLRELLSTIYPDHHFDWSVVDENSIEIHRKKMNEIFQKLYLTELNDWLKVKRFHIIRNGGASLLRFYSNNIKKLLMAVYPNHIWEFKKMSFQPDVNYRKTFEYQMGILNIYREQYLIREKKDWYRISSLDEINLYSSLSSIYANEKWKKILFQNRIKKSKQRILFAILNGIYSSYLLLENYRHPLITNESVWSDSSLEFDIFIPTLNLAFEYQGVQHYDNIPEFFSDPELYRFRDQLKENSSILFDIKLVKIPFWWDQTKQSLISSLSR